METKQKTQNERREEYLKAVVVDPKTMGNKWELRIQISNSQGIKAFGGRMLTAYLHPLTGVSVPLVNLEGQPEIGFMIDRPSMILDPINNPMDRRIIDWLLAHPEVNVEGLSLTDKINSGKKPNSTVSLVNIDRQEMDLIDNENIIDLVIGRLSDESPLKGLSLAKFRYLLAYFNLPYFDRRYITAKTTEKKLLRSRLKNFARTTDSLGRLNAQKIAEVLDEAENLKYHYEFKEMLRLDIVVESNGSYKFHNVPIGSTIESAVNWIKNNLDVYTEMQAALYPALKKEGFEAKQ